MSNSPVAVDSVPDIVQGYCATGDTMSASVEVSRLFQEDFAQV
jgi:hypothetical protein